MSAFSRHVYDGDHSNSRNFTCIDSTRMTRKSDQVTLDILSAWQLNLILFGPGPGDPGKLQQVLAKSNGSPYWLAHSSAYIKRRMAKLGFVWFCLKDPKVFFVDHHSTQLNCHFGCRGISDSGQTLSIVHNRNDPQCAGS